MKFNDEDTAGCLTVVTLIVTAALFIAGALWMRSCSRVEPAEVAEIIPEVIVEPVKAEPVVRVIEVKEVDPVTVFDEPEPYYPLTETQRDELASVLMCETGGVDLDAAMLVAQCVLNASEKDGLEPSEVFGVYGYSCKQKTPNSVCYEAVERVFDNGERITDEPILFFYSPANMPDGISRWHETQDFVLEYAGHRYFKLKG